MLCKTIKVRRRDGKPGWLVVNVEDFQASWMREYQEEEPAAHPGGGSRSEADMLVDAIRLASANDPAMKRPRGRTRKEP